MPEQTKQSALLAKLGNKFKKAVENHANDTFQPGFQTLPGGVRGIAHVNSLKISAYKEGKHKGSPFFMAMATVVYPEEWVGAQTRIGPEPLCATPEANWEGARVTEDDHWQWVANHLHMIGGDGCTAVLAEADDPDAAMEELFEQLVDPENPCYIQFETRQQPPDKIGPRAGQEKSVRHYWIKKVDWTPDDQQTARTTDDTGKEPPKPKPSANGAGKKSSTNRITSSTNKTAVAATPVKRGPGRPKKQQQEEITGDTPEGAVDETASSEEDLDTLAQQAEQGDEESRIRLNELANLAGVSTTDVTNAENWDAVVQLIRDAQGGGATGEAEETSEEVAEEVQETEWYKKGDVVGYKPIVKDKKTGKLVKSSKIVNHEILTVNEDKEIVTLKNLVNDQTVKTSDGKNILGVKFADLLPAI